MAASMPFTSPDDLKAKSDSVWATCDREVRFFRRARVAHYRSALHSSRLIGMSRVCMCIHIAIKSSERTD